MDTAAYRQSESLGRRAIRSERQARSHFPGLFESLGFLTRVESQDDLVVLLDVMHSNRFEDFVAELGGLSDDAMTEVVDALVDYLRFFMATFPSPEAPLPLSGMLSQYAIARKIRGVPRRETVLEIGPGSGLISFFLSRDPAIRRYDQVESVESFYLLQNLVNRHVYGHRFLDHAQLDAGASGLGDIGFEALRATAPDVLANYEMPRTVTVERRPRAEHIPWWRLGLVAGRRYDVVTSNANLTEFSEDAVRYYATLAASVLAPDGVFLLQCPGGGRTNFEMAVRTVMAVRFAPLVMVPRRIADGGARPDGKQMAVANMVFVLPGHPGYPANGGQGRSLPIMDETDPLTRAMFGLDLPAGPVRSRDEVQAAVVERLQALD